MGKLGGGELNFSSDIDLVLLFPEHGETDGSGDQQRGVLHAPWPVAGAAAGDSRPRRASCFASTCGCDRSVTAARWSRVSRPRGLPAAPRPRLGALRLGQGARDHRGRALCGARQRRRAARSSIGATSTSACSRSLREMKALIEREMCSARAGRRHQARRRRHPRDRIHRAVVSADPRRPGSAPADASLRAALPLLVGAKLLPATAVGELDAAYVFLRRLENRLQMRADQQVHQLPAQRSSASAWRSAMGERALDCARGRARRRTASSVSRISAVVLFGARPRRSRRRCARTWAAAGTAGGDRGARRRAGARPAFATAPRPRGCCWIFGLGARARLDEPGSRRLQRAAAGAGRGRRARARRCRRCAGCCGYSRRSASARPTSRCCCTTPRRAPAWWSCAARRFSDRADRRASAAAR